MYACVLSLLKLFATPCSVDHQASFSMGFSRQENLCGLPFFIPLHWMYRDEENTAHGFFPSLSRQSNLYILFAQENLSEIPKLHL